MNNKTTNVRYLAQLALLAAIEVVMKLMGLGSVPVGPLYMSFLTVPIAVGAMTMGPTAGVSYRLPSKVNDASTEPKSVARMAKVLLKPFLGR